MEDCSSSLIYNTARMSDTICIADLFRVIDSSKRFVPDVEDAINIRVDRLIARDTYFVDIIRRHLWRVPDSVHRWITLAYSSIVANFYSSEGSFKRYFFYQRHTSDSVESLEAKYQELIERDKLLSSLKSAVE